MHIICTVLMIGFGSLGKYLHRLSREDNDMCQHCSSAVTRLRSMQSHTPSNSLGKITLQRINEYACLLEGVKELPEM